MTTQLQLINIIIIIIIIIIILYLGCPKSPYRPWIPASLLFDTYRPFLQRVQSGRVLKLTTNLHMVPRIKVTTGVLISP